GPVRAAALRIERIKLAVAPADEDATADDARLRVGHKGAGKREGPFQAQPADRVSAEAGRRGGLETAIGEIGPPAVPAGAVPRREGGAAVGRLALAIGCG